MHSEVISKVHVPVFTYLHTTTGFKTALYPQGQPSMAQGQVEFMAFGRVVKICSIHTRLWDMRSSNFCHLTGPISQRMTYTISTVCHNGCKQFGQSHPIGLKSYMFTVMANK